MVEIERKFLVKSGYDYKVLAKASYKIMQGYLFDADKKSVRIRIKGEQGFLTVKYGLKNSNFTRYEFEYEIPLEDALKLLEFCENKIEKIRYIIDYEGYIYEIDEFLGSNAGLIIAEIELRNEVEDFSRPEFLGQEVTSESKYLNSELSKNPYKNWGD